MSSDVILKINSFLVQWPHAEFGPGHITLGDMNLDDESLDFCIDLARGSVGLPVSDDTKTYLAGLDYNKNHSPAELQATLDFLTTLRAIPEQERED